jgi:hypothetical protein
LLYIVNGNRMLIKAKESPRRYPSISSALGVRRWIIEGFLNRQAHISLEFSPTLPKLSLL